MVGSINWLRAQMESRGANPNVVRNIIYRDKGKLPDKRVLYSILDDLWRSTGQEPLKAPELEVVLAPGSGNDQEILQLLGREKRRTYRDFVQGVRSGTHPKLVVTGRAGSGKTLLSDYIQQALEIEPVAADRIIRLEFGGTDLGTSLTRLGGAVGATLEAIEAKLVKIGSSSAFAVQADAQADVARTILDAARAFSGSQIFILHVSMSLAGQDSMGLASLRLNTPEVPRVSASEWLWLSLFEPLARLPHTALLISMGDVPVRAAQQMGAVDGPVKLTPPTANEARRFVRARLPAANPARHEEIVQRAGRSFEELRTLTLLAEIRDPGAPDEVPVSEKSMTQLSHLVATSSDTRLREFLAAVATLTLAEFPNFRSDVLARLRAAARDGDGVEGAEPGDTLNNIELAFLDAVPGAGDTFRCFSRRLATGLRDALRTELPERHRTLHLAAASLYRNVADEEDPGGDVATRYLSHLFEARAWTALASWMASHGTQQSLVQRIWLAATQELAEGAELETLARQVAGHYVVLGSYQHQDARDAFAVLAVSDDVDTRVWTALQRAEGLTLRGQFDQAEALLASLPEACAPRLEAEAALAQASIARWRGRPDEAARLVRDEVARHLARAGDDPRTRSVRAKAALWDGLIAKDRGDFTAALEAFDVVGGSDDLMSARVAFQRGDVFMKLGHFGRALEALDEAVTLAQRSEALIAEQTRYLSRRGTVHRRRGATVLAAADFEEARQVLASGHGTDRRAQGALADESEHAFWLARVDDEAALNLLAEGRYDEAIHGFERDVRRFHQYADSQGVDGTYRILRATLRLALGYGCRAVSQPFRRPFGITPALDGDHLDLRHARALLQHVVDSIEVAKDREHLGTLYRDALLAANLFAQAGDVSLDLALRSLDESRYPYQRAQAHAHAAFAALRSRSAETADEHVRAAESALLETLEGAPAGERGDLELAAWLIGMDAATALVVRDGQDAGDRVAAGLVRAELAPFHADLLRQFGDSVEQEELIADVLSSDLGTLLDLRGRSTSHPLRFADMLVSLWQRGGITIGVSSAPDERVELGAA
ncbi:hypothetical protein BH23DEI1_BH23DEI1_05810 [soil metagenome]